MSSRQRGEGGGQSGPDLQQPHAVLDAALPPPHPPEDGAENEGGAHVHGSAHAVGGAVAQGLRQRGKEARVRHGGGGRGGAVAPGARLGGRGGGIE